MSAGVPCPDCGSLRSRVTDSRPSDAPVPNMRRRRRCSQCGTRYSTREFLEDMDVDGLVRVDRLSPSARRLVRTIIAALINGEGREA